MRRYGLLVLPFDFNDPKRINSLKQTSKQGIELNPRSRLSMLVITAPRLLSTYQP